MNDDVLPPAEPSAFSAEDAPSDFAPSPDAAAVDRVAWRAALLAAVPALLVYLRTVAPTIAAWDAADFATSAYTLGIAHPPGYPLYTLLGFLFTHLLPVGDVGFRMNVLSAVCATAGVGLTAALAATLTKDVWAGAFAGWVLAFSNNAWWSQAVVAEVYALNCVFFTAVWWLLVRWREYQVPRALFMAAFVFGLGLAHHLSIGMSAPAILVLLVWSLRRAPFKWSWVPLCAGLLLIGPLLYLYLYFRAFQDPVYNFGNPEGWTRFIYHVRAQAYYFRLVDIASSIWLRRFLSVGRVVVEEIGWAGAVAGVAGLVLLARRSRPFAVCALLVVIAYAGYTAAYRIPDIRVYYLPVIIVMATCAGVLLGTVRARVMRQASPRAMAGVLVAVAAVLPVSLAARNWDDNDYHHSRLTREWCEALQRIATKDGSRPAKLFIMGDTDLFVSGYLKIVEKKFPSLTLIDQAGNLYGDFYRVLGQNGGRSIHVIQDGERWELEKNAVLTSREPVYFDPHPGYGLAGVRFVQHGLLFRALPLDQPDPDAGVDFWKYVPDWSRYTDPSKVDPEDRHVLANYHILRGLYALDYERSRGSAEQHWNLAEKFAGDEADVYQNLSRFFSAINQRQRALAACQRVIELVPDEGDSYANLAEVQLGLRDTTQAIANFEKGLAISGFLTSTQYLMLANVYKATGNAARSVLFYRYALGVQPSNPLGWATLASAYVKMGDLARAEYCNKRAITLDPTFAAAHGNLGFVYMNMGRYPDAERELLQCLKLAPDQPRAAANLALLYSESKRPDDALTWWRKTLEIDPHYPDAHFQLGVAASAAGDFATARREMEAEIASNPTNTKALGELGLLEANSGNMGRAVSLWTQVVTLDPRDVRAHFNLATYYKNAGDRARAIAHFQAFLTGMPSGPPADQARAALRELGVAAQ